MSYPLRIVSISIGLLILLGVSSFIDFEKAAATSQSAETAKSLPNLNGDEAKEYLKKQGLYESLGEAMQAARYSIYPTQNAPLENKNALHASNPRQGYSTYFSTDGVTLVSNAKNNKWKIGMNLEQIGHGEDLQSVESGEMKVQPNKANIKIVKSLKDAETQGRGDAEISKSAIRNPQSAIVEWYKNTSAGLEQGWTIQNKLTESNKELRLVMSVKSDLKAKLAANKQAVSFVRKDDSPVVRYEKLKSWDADGKELASRMELDGDRLALVVDDSNAKYPVTVDPFFMQTMKLTASDAAANDFFGYSVGISGDTAIVGAYFNDDAPFDSGSAYIFERNTGGANMWGEVIKLTASDAAASDFFGESVAISGDTAIVGATANDDTGFNSGSAYIFERNQGGANNWGEVQKLTASDAAAGDNFGNSVGISGDTAIVGAFLNDDVPDDSGSAYIFERNQGGANTWGELAKLTASDAAASDQFGRSVGISGDKAIVGAPSNDDVPNNSGSAYIFERNQGGANIWGEVTKLTASDAAAGDFFGFSVGISGDTAIVGAFLDDDVPNNSGSAYIFERNTGGANIWGEVTKLTASDAAVGDEFGRSVDISGDTAIVGARFNADAGSASGSAYIFERNMGGANNWGEVQKLAASDAAGSDRFGSSVGISGDTAIVGAPHKDDVPNNSGSAYIYTNQNNNWQETVTRTSSDGTADDEFGWSVSISGDTAIVGSHEDNDNGLNSGSVYIFERNTGGADFWGEVQKRTASDADASDEFGFSVSISGDTAIVGAPFNDDAGSGSGSAYIFERNIGGANNWGEVLELNASDADSGDQFGYSVGISGDIAIVGARRNSDGGSFSGSAYIFERNSDGAGGTSANNWGEVQKLIASDDSTFDEFGFSVAISGDTAIVGAYGNDDAGADSGTAYIFERNTGGADLWGEVLKFAASDAGSTNQFGHSVSISGDTAIVGARLNDDDGNNSGSAYIFERNMGGANMWGEVKKLTASDAAAEDLFGNAVSISGNLAIVGARFNDDDGNNSGSAYIFERNIGGANNWGEQTKLTALDAAADDQFGYSVSISNGTAIVGAAFKDIPSPFNKRQDNKSFRNATEIGKSGKQIDAPNLAGADQGGMYIFRAFASPTAAPASISGRVLTQNGLGIPFASVILTDQNGDMRTARTNMFGYYRFDNIEVGQILVLNAYNKQYQFDSQVVNLDDSITDLNITAR